MKDITGKVMNAMDVFAICIEHLKENLLSEMNKRFAVDVSMKDVHYVLTVPGIWGDAAKMFMQKAAAQVRFKMHCISLPATLNFQFMCNNAKKTLTANLLCNY